MSRIGNQPVSIPEGVSVSRESSLVKVKGPKGELFQHVDADFDVKIEEGELTLSRPTEQKRHKSLHGLYRSLVANMVEGVSEGFKKELELVGVGYRANVQGNILELNLGYSHNIFLQIPEGIKVTAETAKGKNPIVTLEGYDKQLVGQVAAKIKSLRPVEPYKGKGIRFVGEIVRRKAGKTAAK
ncbi:50S ribosomal protein L6 [Tunicatimonas pelagia]|uniref:50S ribosomal protein L6 n=1 Tax=Tunicatimonas pelagia TaxID=931531 RepID=UPI00266553DF|nr:50S ribosomal protein L6 [Tunicatimonas pelagia]WKN42268.1 50S ribosomal protein L6 [Tunicatimonas pelagia]